MRLILLVVAMIALTGCGQQNVRDVLGNLERDCTRHYAGAINGGVPPSGTVTFQIDCQPLAPTLPLPPSAPTK